jgi:ribosomal-protein-alanine N-acetyltransferase
MLKTDIDEVMEIERQSFDHPWSRCQLLDKIAEDEAIAVVVEAINIDKVIGYMIYESQNEYIQLSAIAVHPYYRLQGVGSSLLFKLTNDLISLYRRKNLTALVRETNLGAQLFFAANKWKAVKIIKGYNEDNKPEDVYQFVWDPDYL